MTKLKPCPFCGGEAGISEVEEESLGYNEIINYEVGCHRCRIETLALRDLNDAIEAWNTRQPAINWQPMHTMPEDRHVSLKTKTGAIIKGKYFQSLTPRQEHFYIEHSDLFNPEYIERICLSVNFVGWTELLEGQ